MIMALFIGQIISWRDMGLSRSSKRQLGPVTLLFRSETAFPANDVDTGESTLFNNVTGKAIRDYTGTP